MAKRNSVNNFLPILDTWKDYFSDPNEGLGTTYERFLLHDLFLMIDRREEIQTVLEVPSFGMTGISGINSMWWAQQGKKVCILDDDQQRVEYIRATWKKVNLSGEILYHDDARLSFPPQSMDLIWNFAALWFVSNLDDFAAQVKTIAGKAILICVPNTKGLGFLLRKKHAQNLPRIHLENIQPGTVQKAFSGDGWHLWKKGIFDVPPWPDIPMKKEDLLVKIKLGFLVKWLSSAGSNGKENPAWCILDYFSGKDPSLEQKILRYGILEKAPQIIKTFWGHHRYFIFVKEHK